MELKTIEEQLDRLENRVIAVTDRTAAKECLLSNSYYSVVNGFKFMFLDKEKSRAAGSLTFGKIERNKLSTSDDPCRMGGGCVVPLVLSVW
ncbi:hypothetical protein [Collinsella tanakaei]|uniref:hypothetical protein n=1 Tax=Collinsella tanakaei TaxID=626935 RepID=UPI00265A2ED3|nr:hypothetical protein [Collinsella tanakaei]